MTERGARRDSRQQVEKERRGGVEYRLGLEPAEVHNDEHERGGCESERNRRRSGKRERDPRSGQQADGDVRQRVRADDGVEQGRAHQTDAGKRHCNGGEPQRRDKTARHRAQGHRSGVGSHMRSIVRQRGVPPAGACG